MPPAQQAHATRLRPHRALVVGQRIHDLATHFQMIKRVLFDDDAVEIDIEPARRLNEAVVLIGVEQCHARIDRAVVSLDGASLHARMLFQLPLRGIERHADHLVSIVARFVREFRGVVEYYQLAQNRSALQRLCWVMELSLAKTLAAKLRLSVKQVFRRFKTTIPTSDGPQRVLLATVERPGDKPLVAHWGGISLARQRRGGCG